MERLAGLGLWDWEMEIKLKSQMGEGSDEKSVPQTGKCEKEMR